jgi:hypothetical protein
MHQGFPPGDLTRQRTVHNTVAEFLDFVNRPEKTTFRKLDLFPSRNLVIQSNFCRIKIYGCDVSYSHWLGVNTIAVPRTLWP